MQEAVEHERSGQTVQQNTRRSRGFLPISLMFSIVIIKHTKFPPHIRLNFQTNFFSKGVKVALGVMCSLTKYPERSQSQALLRLHCAKTNLSVTN